MSQDGIIQEGYLEKLAVSAPTLLYAASGVEPRLSEFIPVHSNYRCSVFAV